MITTISILALMRTLLPALSTRIGESVKVCHTIQVAENKPRIFQDGRDISMTLIVIIAVMALTVAFTGMCSLNPGRPENGPVQEVDARQFLDIEARGDGFPAALPPDARRLDD